MASQGKFYTTRPVPAIARVDFFEINLDHGATTTLVGTVRMGPNKRLEYDPHSHIRVAQQGIHVGTNVRQRHRLREHHDCAERLRPHLGNVVVHER
jgi:hypothetical protein